MKALTIALASVGAMATVAAVGVVTIRSDWFRDQVRQRIVVEAERATGGKVEIGDFRFAWDSLTAEIDNLTIHGTEQEMQPVQAPLLHVKHALIGLKIVSLVERSFSIARVEVESPQGHLMVKPDGTTNIRPPKTPAKGTVVDLKIGRFAARDGLLLIEVAGRPPMPVPWSGRAENIAALLHYEGAKKAYSGDISVAPAHVEIPGIEPVDASVKADVRVEANRIISASTVVKTAASEFDFSNVTLESFTSPVLTATYKARVAMEEIDRVFRLVNFRHTGNMDVDGTLRFVSPENYLISGAGRGSGLGYGQVRNISASGKFIANPNSVRIDDARLAALGGALRAAGEVKDFSRFTVNGDMGGLEARVVTELAGAKPLPWNGVVSGPFHASGNLSEHDLHSLVADGNLAIAPARNEPPVRGQVAARFEGATKKIAFDPSWIELPATRVDFSGTPNERMEVRAQSRDINEFRPVIAIPPAIHGGAGSFEGSLTGSLSDPRVTGHAALRQIVVEDERIGTEHIESAEGDVSISDSGLVVDKTSVVWNGLRADIKGSLGLNDWKADEHSAIRADVQVANADAAKLLDLAGRGDLPVTGNLTAKGQVAGTAGDPQFSGDFTLIKGQVADEPFDSITGHSRYNATGASQANAAIVAGSKRLEVTATLDDSKVKFGLTSNTVQLEQIAWVKKQEPDVRGTARVRLDGTVELSADGKRVTIEEIGGDVTASGLAFGTRNFGEAHLSGTSRNGVFEGQFTSNAVNATIRADGTVGLSGGYPVNAKVAVAGLRLANVDAILGPASRPEGAALVDGSIEGQATITGPAGEPEKLRAAIELTKVELHAATAEVQQSLHNFSVANDGPVRMELTSSVIRLQTAHFRGPETDLEGGGQIALRETAPLDLTVHGTLNTALAKAWEPDLTASGTVAVNATLRGTYDKPDFTGRAELQNGEFRYAGFTNGLTNARGVALFSGTRATIQSFTGETGGGTVEMTGFSSLTDSVIAFRVEAKARSVRVRYPEGISSVSDADLTFAGTEARSEASGKITVRRVSITPKSDAATILSQATSPIRTAAANTGLAANINLDVQIETANDVVFETNMAQGVQADANLRLRGTVTSPALLGRINVTHGDMVFFGNKYSISQGSLTFSDPARIAPVLNVDLGTKARGVDVTLTVSGPVNKLNVSYRSDPPLQFADIVALLATGRTPTSATLATNTGQSPNFQQLNGSALLGQALTNPAADRLQRFFGVSRIKIDPQLTGVTGSPEARLTIEQEVSPELLFTYVSDVSNTSTQLIRVEWSFSRTWSTILTREENGYVSLDFAYRKRFK